MLHKRKTDPFFLSLEIPSSKELRLLKNGYPTAASTFAGELDVFKKADTLQLLTEARAFISANNSSLRMRTAKAIEVRFTNRDLVLGPATGIVGFELKGAWCRADVVEHGCDISWYDGDLKKHFFVTSEMYPIDDGVLIVHFRKGTCLYDFFARIANTLGSVSQKSIWSYVES